MLTTLQAGSATMCIKKLPELIGVVGKVGPVVIIKTYNDMQSLEK